MDRDPNHLYPLFLAKVDAVIAQMNDWCAVHYDGHHVRLFEGFRSAARQAELYAQGRTAPGEIVTYKDGYSSLSKHQSGLAADLYPFGNGWVLDPPNEFWDYLGHLARAQSLEWGGDWPTFADRPHIQWPHSDSATYSDAAAWLKHISAGISS